MPPRPITETKTGRVVAMYPINVKGQNYTPGAEEHIDLAWENAVDDRLVDAKRKTGYSFQVRDVPVKL